MIAPTDPAQAEYARPCPVCRAQVGHPCRNAATGSPMHDSHALRRREPAATSETWTEADARMSANIARHPDFAQLVREVAVAEQPGFPGYTRLRMNSLTSGQWVLRGMPARRTGPLRRRAQTLAEAIAADLDIHPNHPRGEGAARVYVQARYAVRARQRGR